VGGLGDLRVLPGQPAAHLGQLLRAQRPHSRSPHRPRRVASGQAEPGEPWQHYDLGHGLCACTFIEQCQHRVACAKCDFYIPKNSSRAQLLEAKANLRRHGYTALLPLVGVRKGPPRHAGLESAES
jgi:hypothetical protein